ncbi:MAG: hypothetical protein IJM54_11155 [Thermoguttaceae bacterium]|nr:hypothetical protein [Thermoguttaceae bacterium]
MNKQAYKRIPKAAVLVPAFVVLVVVCAPTREANAGNFGLSLNVGRVSFGLGIGDSYGDSGYYGAPAAVATPALAPPPPHRAPIVRGQAPGPQPGGPMRLPSYGPGPDPRHGGPTRLPSYGPSRAPTPRPSLNDRPLGPNYQSYRPTPVGRPVYPGPRY